MKKKILLLVIFLFILVIVVFYVVRDVKDRTLIAQEEARYNELIAQFGGQEKVSELYVNNQNFCLRDSDCIIEETVCCKQPINKYHVRSDGPITPGFNCPDPDNNMFYMCDMIDRVICRNNRCVGIYENDWGTLIAKPKRTISDIYIDILKKFTK